MSGTLAPSGKNQNPSEFLKEMIGKTVKVKLNNGSDYKGTLRCLDGCLNIVLEQTEEYINGEFKRRYGDAFIREISLEMGNCLKGSVSIDDVSLITDNTNQGDLSGSPPTYQSEPTTQSIPQSPIYYPAPCSRLISQLAEEEQIKIAKRIGLIQHLPSGTYDGGSSSKKSKECVICMIDFVVGDSIRFLPCMHKYHMKCIDDWLMRSFTCPSCMVPVDAALLSTFQ